MKKLVIPISFSLVLSLLAFAQNNSYRKGPNSSTNKDTFGFGKAQIGNEWYLGSQDTRVFLFIREIGKGEPVIVLHGGPGAGHRYLLHITNGLENQFRFIFYDQRGAGFTYSSKDNISMENNVQDLESIRMALGLDKINLISHSAGTMLAMNYLQKYPANVKNLVLLGALDPKNGKAEFFTSEELEMFKKNAGIRDHFFNKRPEIQAEISKGGLNKPNLTPNERHRVRRIMSAAGNIYPSTVGARRYFS